MMIGDTPDPSFANPSRGEVLQQRRCSNIVLNGMGAPADVEKELSAIESDFGVKAVYSPADMAKPNEIAELITLGEKTFGRVDVLVNNSRITEA